jgi:nitroreductase
VELQEAIRNRRSIRKYLNKDIPENVLSEILEAGICAPFAFQRWLLICVRDRENKEAMLKDFYDQKRNLHVLNAPVNIVVCCDLRNENWPESANKDHGKDDFKLVFGIQETAAMIQNMLLTAHEYGLGTCWNGSFNEKRVASVLNIPEGIRPIAIVSLGYPGEKPAVRKRRSLNQIVYKERFA